MNPAFVNLADRGGLGWLDGFDELMVRCGLDNNGAPFEVTHPNPDGSVARHQVHGLHGRIANIPAHHVSVHVEDAPPHAITVEGKVAESTLFHPQLELATRITTEPGSNRLVVVDEVANRSDSPGSLQLLYHWNFGPPYLGEGSEFAAPVEAIAPRDLRAAEGLGHWQTYGAPEPGFAEQVYLARLRGDAPGGRTLAMLKGPDGTRAVVLRFRTAQLPCFTLWKSTRGLREGYVTGLEPATNYPNPRPFEAARGRVVPLEPRRHLPGRDHPRGPRHPPGHRPRRGRGRGPPVPGPPDDPTPPPSSPFTPLRLSPERPTRRTPPCRPRELHPI